jgi:hypothetical protein
MQKVVLAGSNCSWQLLQHLKDRSSIQLSHATKNRPEVGRWLLAAKCRCTTLTLVWQCAQHCLRSSKALLMLMLWNSALLLATA